jgi:cytochrome P450
MTATRIASESTIRRPALAPARSALTWLLAFGLPRGLMRVGVRAGDLIARAVGDPALGDDPFAVYDEVRARGPMTRGRGISATASHAAANAVLRGDAFGVAAGHGELSARTRRMLDVIAEPGALGPLSPPSLLATDPPEHTRYRRLVARVFTPRAIAALAPRVSRVAEDLLDRLPDRFDLVERYSAQLPVAVICEILGVPEDMRERVLRWGDGIAVRLDPGLSWRQYRTATRDLREISEWFDDHVARLRRDPGDDLLSNLARLDGADRLTDVEMRATGLLVLGAGFETTVNLIGNAVALLDAHPGQLSAALEQDLWPGVVEETLRYDSPVQFTLRQAYTDAEVAGTRVKAGTGVVVMLGGANRDPEVFADPHRFDVTRANATEHLAFAGGVHYCLGASLARQEATVALRALYTPLPAPASTSHPGAPGDQGAARLPPPARDHGGTAVKRVNAIVPLTGCRRGPKAARARPPRRDS